MRVLRWGFVSIFALLIGLSGWLVACGPSLPPSETTSERSSEKTAETTTEAITETTTEKTDGSLPEETTSEIQAEAAPEAMPEAKPEAMPEAKPEVGPEEPQGGKINAPAKQWTWVDFPDTKCGYGSATGLGVNLNPGSKVALIYLQGGGACWAESGFIGACFGAQPTASNLGGYGQTQFTGEGTKNAFHFRRDPTKNLLADAHFVFLPYCTGDVFSGQNKVDFSPGKTVYFHGFLNIEAYLKRLVPTLEGVERIVLAGSSAGGFGAAINWEVVQTAFGSKVRVDLLDDSGHPIDPIPSRWQEWQSTWKPHLPPTCADCSQGVGKILDHYEKTLLAQGRKMALLTYERDAVIRSFMGYLDTTGNLFKAEHDKLLLRMDNLPNARYFGMTGQKHVMLSEPDKLTSTGGVSLVSWIEWMYNDDPKWVNQKP